MNLEEKINTDIKAAMLAREKDKLDALRAIKSAILLMKTSGSADNAGDAETKMLQKLVKQRKESAEIFISQNRQDLANIELGQAAVIENYLPKQMSEEEIKIILQKIISENGATSPADFGKIMGIASKQLSGKTDGKTISILVKQLLS